MGKRKSVIDMGVAHFKAHCTAILPEVKATGRVVRVFRRGELLAEIHPPTTQPAEPLFGRLAGVATHMGDVHSPVDVEWDVLGE